MMIKTIKYLSMATSIAVSLVMTQAAHATLIGVSGPSSTLDLIDTGNGPEILASAPANLLDSVAFNDHQQGFNEQQGVVLGSAITTDQGVIAAGTRVDSHMIFLNKQDGIPGILRHFDVEWTFDGIILGTMSDSGGLLEAASTPLLGAIGSVYGAPFAARGMEGADSLTISGNRLMASVDMLVAQPGDWIRVVTATKVPEPATLGLLGVGLLGLGLARRRRHVA